MYLKKEKGRESQAKKREKRENIIIFCDKF